MSELSSHLEIAVASISCFSNDGTLDAGEVKYLLGIAMRDGVMDSEEKRVLKNVFSKIGPADVDAGTWKLITEIKEKHNF